MRHLELQRYLSRTAARRVRLRLTDDRRSIVLAQPASDESVGVTLHGMFLDAPNNVLRALARFVRKPQLELKRRVIRLYRETGLDRTGERRPQTRSVTLRHKGAEFDLKALYDLVNEEYFGASLQAFITWGRRSSVPGGRSIHFGSYNWDRRLIRINPALDRYFVPRYFIESIIFHEMLHADLGVRSDVNGRRSAHSREFHERETMFRHHARARQWERRNLHRFLRPTRR